MVKKRNEIRRNMRREFGKYGIFMVSFTPPSPSDISNGDGDGGGDDEWNEEMMRGLVEGILGGDPMEHIPSDPSRTVWHILPSPPSLHHDNINNVTKDNCNDNCKEEEGGKQKERGKARSHTMEEFKMHTDASWERDPPRGVALGVIRSDRFGGGLLSLFPFSSLLTLLPPSVQSTLTSLHCTYLTPPEFLPLSSPSSIASSSSERLITAKEKKRKEEIESIRGFKIGEGRYRYRYDIMNLLPDSLLSSYLFPHLQSADCPSNSAECKECECEDCKDCLCKDCECKESECKECKDCLCKCKGEREEEDSERMKREREALEIFNREGGKKMEDERYQRGIGEKYLIVFDNQRYLHARSMIRDPLRHLLRIRFHLPSHRSPSLDLLLLSSPSSLKVEEEEGGGDLEMDSYQVRKEVKKVKEEKINDAIYWSCSGQSGTLLLPLNNNNNTNNNNNNNNNNNDNNNNDNINNNRNNNEGKGEEKSKEGESKEEEEKSKEGEKIFMKKVGSGMEGNERMRKRLAEELKKSGMIGKEIRLANMFSYSPMQRSGEIIGDLVKYCGATNLPIGSLPLSPSSYRYLFNGDDDDNDEDGFQINAIGGFSNMIIHLAQLASEGKISMRKIKVIVFAGEDLPHSHRQFISSQCYRGGEGGGGVGYVGLYGSAEGGVFAYQTPSIIQSAFLLSLPSSSSPLPFYIYAKQYTNIYKYLDDLVHIEIIPLLEDKNGNDENILHKWEKDEYGNMIKKGNIIISNNMRRPAMIRYNSGDVASFVYDHNGDRVADRSLFYFLGRNKTRSVPLGRDWLIFDDILSFVLSPFSLHFHLSQVHLYNNNHHNNNNNNNNNDYSDHKVVIKLLILIKEEKEISEEKYGSLCEKWKELLMKLMGEESSFIPLVTLTQDKSLLLLSRNQKLLKFVDSR